MRRYRFAAAILGILALPQVAPAGTISGETRSLEREVLEGVLVEAFEVSPNGVVSQTPFASARSNAMGQYTIDVGRTERLILRFSRADRNTTFVPNLPTATTGGAISGLRDVTNFDVLVPRLGDIAEY